MTNSKKLGRHLEILARQYPTTASAASEIINLTSILNLPKGTEHFVSDIHGEYESFIHVLKNASGVIIRKIDGEFGETISEDEKRGLASLIYYPEQKLALLRQAGIPTPRWYEKTLLRLIRVCRQITSMYTRSKVRKVLPAEFAYIIEELLQDQEAIKNRHNYYRSIINTVISTKRGDAFIIALANLIQRLAIDKLHIIGDIFDRGPGADIILDTLMRYNHNDIDIQWGNHDILWMGAAAGSDACIANALRISIKYLNTATLEDGYAISLLPLASFATEYYGSDPCERFMPKRESASPGRFSDHEIGLLSRMHKAITVIQFKLEGQLIRRRPHYDMEERDIISRINYKNGTVTIDGISHKLLDRHFPTVDPRDPLKLTDAERSVVDKLRESFLNSEKLQNHVKFLFSRGSMYLCRDNKLLFHGCIPMNEDGTFKIMHVAGKSFTGKNYMDRVDTIARQGYFSPEKSEARIYGMDLMWYLWTGNKSPLYGKALMTTFERYFIKDSSTHEETKNPYYLFRENEAACRRILAEFGLNPDTGVIINGHVPVKVRKGESPMKAEGKMIVIDGGFSKAYQSETGIAGYTLISNSHGLVIVSHLPFESTRKAIIEEKDIHSSHIILNTTKKRIFVKDSDLGRELNRQILDLKQLLKAYADGRIKEKN